MSVVLLWHGDVGQLILTALVFLMKLLLDTALM